MVTQCSGPGMGPTACDHGCLSGSAVGMNVGTTLTRSWFCCIATATAAADLPALWWTVAALWMVASVVDAWRLARRTPAGASWRTPVTVGVVVTCVLVAGFIG